MDSVRAWTGRTACALQAALRLSNESFAEHLGIAVRTVAAWHQKPMLKPKSEMQQLLDTAIEQASPAVNTRFTQYLAEFADTLGTRSNRAQLSELPHALPSQHVCARQGSAATVDAQRRLHTDDPHIHAALDWLDRSAGWAPGASRDLVDLRLAQLSFRDLQDRGSRRRRVNQHHIAQALADYYREPLASHGRYMARYGGTREAATSVLTCADWLDLDCRLLGENDRLTLADAGSGEGISLDDHAADHAVKRLVETLALNTRLVDTPLYRLMNIDAKRGQIVGEVGVTPFVHYALTMDLLEGELIDTIAAGTSVRRGGLPLRDRYLPDTESVLDVSGRLCAGGVLALCAIARPEGLHGGLSETQLEEVK